MLEKRSRKELTSAILLLLLLGLTTLTGCSFNRAIILHPIDKVDIVSMQKGIPYTPEKDGWFLSDLYLNDVVRARVQK